VNVREAAPVEVVLERVDDNVRFLGRRHDGDGGFPEPAANLERPPNAPIADEGKQEGSLMVGDRRNVRLLDVETAERINE
jgi:hypothetical protein